MSKTDLNGQNVEHIGDTLPKCRVAAVQASPVFLNRDATIEKLGRLVEEAKSNGADLVVFPESFIPTFPLWCLFLPPIDQHPFYKRLFENAIAVPSPAFHELQRIAKKNKIFLSVGITEKSTDTFGTMWNTNLIFDREGKMISRHRKLLPTWGEKLVWSFGDGSSLTVHDTEIGRLGALICGENSNTLARYTMVAQGEQLHISVYPPCWPTARAKGDYADCLRVRTSAHAFEGKLFNICSSAALGDDAIEELSMGDPALKEWLQDQGWAITMIAGPNGQPMCEPITDNREGIIYADCDIANQITMKGIHDIAGAYQRFDVFQLHVNKTQRKPAYFYDENVDCSLSDFDESIPFVEEEEIDE